MADAEVQLQVNSEILELVAKYMAYHNGKPVKEIVRPLSSVYFFMCSSVWDAHLVDLDETTLFDLILVKKKIIFFLPSFFFFLQAANYMHIKPLLELVCAKFASCIHGFTMSMLTETSDQSMFFFFFF